MYLRMLRWQYWEILHFMQEIQVRNWLSINRKVVRYAICVRSKTYFGMFRERIISKLRCTKWQSGKENGDMLKVKFYDTVDDALLKFAVIISQSKGKWVMCKHKERDTV